MRATVKLAASRMMASKVSGPSHVELNSTRVRDMSMTLPSCARYVSAFARISSRVSGLRVSERPVGSPISPVKSPMMTMI